MCDPRSIAVTSIVYAINVHAYTRKPKTHNNYFVLQLHAETEVPVEPQRIVATSKCNYKLKNNNYKVISLYIIILE